MRKAVVTLTALALLWGMTGTGSAQPLSVGVQYITSPDSVIPTGGTVTHFVGVHISPDETMTVTSIQSALSGDLADASNPMLISTTCSVPSLHNPGEFVGAYEWGCEFTVFVSGEPGEVVDTVTVAVVGEDSTEYVASAQSVVTISTEDGAIQGTLTDAVTGMPIAGAWIDVVGSAEGGSDRTNATGFYDIQGLAPGDYRMVSGNTQVWAEAEYARTWYLGGGTYASAAVVAVNPGMATVVDWSLSPGGVIEGTVTDATTGEPLEGLYVDVVYEEAGSPYSWGYGPPTGVDGTYRFFGLFAGQYLVCFWTDGYERECWNGHTFPVGSDWGSISGDPIAVELGSTISGIDAALTPLVSPDGNGANGGNGPDDGDLLPFTGRDVSLMAALGAGLLILGLTVVGRRARNATCACGSPGRVDH